MSPQPQPVTLPFVFKDGEVNTPLDLTIGELPLFFDPSIYPDDGGSYPPTVGDPEEANYRQDVRGEAGFEIQLDLEFNDSDEIEVIVKTSKEYNGGQIVSSKAVADSGDPDNTNITPNTVTFTKAKWGSARVTVPVSFFTPFSNFCQVYVKDVTAGFSGTRAQLHGFDLVYGASGF